MADLGHFDYLTADEQDALFSVPPTTFRRDADGAVLAHGLGATLYCPATRPDLVADLVRARRQGVVSSVICLEDSIADNEVEDALAQVIDQVGLMHDDVASVPLTFVRVRTAAQITEIVRGLGKRADALSGFVLPKFDAASGVLGLDAVRSSGEELGRCLWAMPVIETPEVAHRETRTDALLALHELLDANRDLVLAVRIGATDLAGVHGLRRPKELTAYDLRVVADAIADIVNVLGRTSHGWVISGAVWEYFAGAERIFKPQLRETPFGAEDRALRAGLIAAELDGLIREVVLDRANGIVGKTVIHPTHVSLVHALSVVSAEDHSDALAVLGQGDEGGGVVRSEYGNKMNESKPHRAWALRALRRADAFGVARDDVSFADLLAAVFRA